ncbi:MAG TPA: hypothetical protein DCM08_10265 [Microscillaceae bacterium]|jgi:hypothetical protein|nr:hypothetical protein [Microscillaceae bacterium]
MTLAEKRELLIKAIQQMDEQDLDKLLTALSSKSENGEGKDDFERYLLETTRQYKKVWETLS